MLLLVGSGFSPSVCITVTKNAISEDRTHDLKIMRLTRCQLRHCRCLLNGASVKLLGPCTLMRPSGITLLSSYLLCCLWQVRIELTTLWFWDLRAADSAIVAVFVMVQQWRYRSLVRWCGIPEWHCCQAIFCAAFGWLLFFPYCLYYCDKKCDKWGSNSRQ